MISIIAFASGLSLFGKVQLGLVNVTSALIVSQNGKKHILSFCTAVVLIEFFQIVLSYEVVQIALSIGFLRESISYFMIVLFFAMGVKSIINYRKQNQLNIGDSKKYNSPWRYGFLISLINLNAPSFWIFWISYLKTNNQLHMGRSEMMIFAIVAIIVSWATIVSYGLLGLKIDKYIEQFKKKSDLVIGILLFAFAFFQVYHLVY